MRKTEVLIVNRYAEPKDLVELIDGSNTYISVVWTMHPDTVLLDNGSKAYIYEHCDKDWLRRQGNFLPHPLLDWNEDKQCWMQMNL